MANNVSSRTPEDQCVQCHKVLDAATDVSSDREAKPAAGDYTVCFYCAALYTFDKTLRLVPAALADIDDDELRAGIEEVQRAVGLRRIVHG